MLTGVQADERGGAGEIAGGGVGGATGSEEVVVECVGRVRQEVGRLVAGAAQLDGAAVGAAVGAASPVDSRLQRAILGVILRDAPELTATAHRDGPCGAADSRVGGEEEEGEGKVERGRRGRHHHWGSDDLGVADWRM